MYGVAPPDAVIALLYATPTAPFGREVVVIVRVRAGTVGVGDLLTDPHPVRNAAATTMKPLPKLRMLTIPIQIFPASYSLRGLSRGD